MTTTPQTAPGAARPRADGLSFIETQLPVSKLSKESYRERKAVAGQTLTALGKWWGRKPLVLVRAAILGLLLPATDDPEADRETFLALMTMDEDGLVRRVKGGIPPAAVYLHCTATERAECFVVVGGKPKWRPGISAAEREWLQRLAFLRMGYDEKLKYTVRPEEIDGPSPKAWAKINAHLGTQAGTLPELVRELGERRFGHTPRVADAFCGGGSVPFEAARIGCTAYGSDLSPVAALLTWGALNLVGGGKEAVERARAVQQRVFDTVQRQVDEWGIERNEQGWIADAYLYCNEVVDPATGWRVPLAPSWVIAPKTRVIARLVPDRGNRRFEIEIAENVSDAEFARAQEQDDQRRTKERTWDDGLRSPVDREGNWLPTAARQTTSFDQLRGRAGLRLWENDDVVPRPNDVFQERLYCIRWVDPKTSQRHYRAPTLEDLGREQQVLHLLRERFADWQASGYIPSQRIEPGTDNMRPTNARGWTYWHHFFTPRQLGSVCKGYG